MFWADIPCLSSCVGGWDIIPPYAAMIGHVLACLTDQVSNLIEPSSALPALDVHQRLTQPAGQPAQLISIFRVSPGIPCGGRHAGVKIGVGLPADAGVSLGL
jgi:hypothetical protein